MPQPTTEVLFQGDQSRIIFTDRDGDGVWLTRDDRGAVIVESEDLYIALTTEQVEALRAWLKRETAPKT